MAPAVSRVESDWRRLAVRDIVRLAHALSEHVILAEGNVACRLDGGEMLVKASGARLADAAETSFVSVSIDEVIRYLDGGQPPALASRLKPSVETPLHAVLLTHTDATFIGHTHPVAANSILCSRHASTIVRPLFPDQIVVCGPNPLFIPYADPGPALAEMVRCHLLAQPEPPKVIYLQNHGIVALGSTAQEVVRTTAMAVKAAEILASALAIGGATFLPEEEIARIDGRADEAYRREELARLDAEPAIDSAAGGQAVKE